MSVPFAIDQIDVVTTSGIDRYGKAQDITTASGVPARVEYLNRMVLNAGGEQVLSDFTAYVNGDVAVKSGDKVTYDGGTYLLLQVRKQKDDVSVHHQELVGRTWRRT